MSLLILGKLCIALLNSHIPRLVDFVYISAVLVAPFFYDMSSSLTAVIARTDFSFVIMYWPKRFSVGKLKLQLLASFSSSAKTTFPNTEISKDSVEIPYLPFFKGCREPGFSMRKKGKQTNNFSSKVYVYWGKYLFLRSIHVLPSLFTEVPSSGT